jgi:uncharacterized protein (TIGR02186 family)
MRIALVLVVGLFAAPGAFAQPRGEGPQQPAIAAGLAEDRVEVKVNYSGARIVLFVTAPPNENESSGLAVALIGPSAPHKVIRRTTAGERSFEFVAAPTIFAIGAEPQVAQTVSPEIMIESGLNAAASAMPRSDQLMSPELEDWRRAFVDLKMAQGQYFFDDTTIERLEGGLRRARIALPPSAPPGEYRVRAVAFRNGQRVGETDQVLTLVRGGMDATLFDLSRQHGVIYGFLAVMLAAAVGAVAAWVGRR